MLCDQTGIRYCYMLLRFINGSKCKCGPLKCLDDSYIRLISNFPRCYKFYYAISRQKETFCDVGKR